MYFGEVPFRLVHISWSCLVPINSLFHIVSYRNLFSRTSCVGRDLEISVRCFFIDRGVFELLVPFYLL